MSVVLRIFHKFNQEDPNNPELFMVGESQPISLKSLKKRVTQRLETITESIEENDTHQNWKSTLYRIDNNILNDIKAIIEAQVELEKIRSLGGIRSRGIKKIKV